MDWGTTMRWRHAPGPGRTPADIFNFVPYPGAPDGDVDTYIKPSLVPGCVTTGLPASRPRSSPPPAAAGGQRLSKP